MIMGKGLWPVLKNAETKRAILDARKTRVMLMFIIANALIFAHVLAAERIPQTITKWMLGVDLTGLRF